MDHTNFFNIVRSVLSKDVHLCHTYKNNKQNKKKKNCQKSKQIDETTLKC